MQQSSINLLATITNKIAGTADKIELLKAIHELVMPLFEIESTGLFIINEAENYHYDLAVMYPELDNSQLNRRHAGEISNYKIEHTGTLLARHFSELKKKQGPLIFDFESDFKKYPHPFSEVILSEGYKETYAALLRINSEPLGIFYINSKQRGLLQKTDAGIFQQVTDLIAIAIANILAKEEIQKREKEKSVLLSFSKKIAAIRDKNGLLDTMFQDIKLLFPFDSAVFAFYDDKLEYTQHLRHTHHKSYEENNHYRRIMSEKIPTLNSPYGEFKYYEKPTILSFEYLWEKYPDHTGINIMKDFGLTECVIMPLRYGNRLLATFEMHSYKKGNFSPALIPLYENLSNQLSVTVANILANEELLHREREKSRQLEILETLNQCNGWDDKFMAVAQKFDEFIGCDLFSYSIRLNDGKRIGKGFMKQPDTGLFIPKSLQEYLHDMDITETEYRELYGQAMDFFTGSRYYCGTELEAAAQKTALLKKSIEAYKTSSLMFTEKRFPKGTMLFTFKSGNQQQYNNATLQFLEATAQQMTLSVMNILDNEDLIEREKQKTLEIQVNNAVLTNEYFSDVMRDIAGSIGKAVGCDICYIRVMSEQFDPKPFHFFCERVDGKYVVKAVDDKVADTGISAAQAAKNAAVFLTTMKSPTILSGIALETLIPQYQYLQIFTGKIGIRSFIFLPLQLKYNCTGYLIIGSRTPYAYLDSDLELIRNIKAQLSLALDNRLAFHQIQRLKEMLETENLYLQEAINENYNFNEMVGSSAALQTVFTQASMVAATDTTVLIGGETGTGKELIARAIHNLSNRKDKIMVKVNCACLPAQLIESELFGHEKGAFTGAVEKRIGKFELANGGTVFLDEIGELPLELQAKLLRVIQEREFERIGGRTTLKTDIRIIAATNKDLELESREKRFRSDLFYRLNVFPIHLPALRDRKEDIPLLALHFAKKFGQKMGKRISAITNDALQEMIHYDWPGNIRELEHVVEHSVISNKSSKLSLARPLLTNKSTEPRSLSSFRIKTLNDNERDHILAILKYCNGRVRGNGGAAQLLDIHPNTLESRMLKLGIRKEHVLFSS